MKYIFLGNFTLKGAGYTTIMRNVSLDLVKNGHEVMILGIKYDKSAHDFPFKIVPMEFEWSYEALLNLPDEWKADRVIVALDVDKLSRLADKFLEEKEEHRLWLLEALFPVESGPLTKKWARNLGKFRNRFVISEFGVEECKKSGLTSLYLPMGCRVGTMPSTKSKPRELLNWPVDNTTIFLTVADNHERKALPLAMQAFSRLPDNSQYYILTDATSPLGWNLVELAEEYGISDRFFVINSGISRGVLSTIYWAADALVVSSQAEGACLPIYEAAAHGLPVIGGTWTALSDVSEESWYLEVSADYTYRYPWGNVNRWYASVDDLEYRMVEVMTTRNYDSMSEAAIEFANGKAWSVAAGIIESAGLDAYKKEKEIKLQTV